jgi:hypothetical protein
MLKETLRNVLTAGTFALCTAIGLTAAKADVLRVVVVVAESEADYANNAALLPTIVELMKKGGVKVVYAGTDATKMSTTTSSVWASEADIVAVTGSADWKVVVAKLKSKPITPEVFQLLTP